MSRYYLVHLPRAEALHLAGIGPGWPARRQGRPRAGRETRCVLAIRGWLHGGKGGEPGAAPAGTPEPAQGQVMVAQRPLRGPFAPGSTGGLPGDVAYLGDGLVRLDDTAISSLAQLRPGDDFRVTFEDVGPVLSVGRDWYVALEEEPGAV